MAELGIDVRTVVNGHPQALADGRARCRIRTGDHLARSAHDVSARVERVDASTLLHLLQPSAGAATRYQPDLTVEGDAK